MHTIFVISVLSVTGAAVTRYDGLTERGIRRPAAAGPDVTHAYVNRNERRSIDSYVRHDYVENTQGRKKEVFDKYKDIPPNIVFPDQLPYIPRTTTVRGELVSRYESAKGKPSLYTTHNMNITINMTVSNTTNTEAPDAADNVGVQQLTASAHEQTIGTGHRTRPDDIKSGNKNVEPPATSGDITNQDMLIVKVNQTVLDIIFKDNEVPAGNVEKAEPAWAWPETSTPSDLDDRAAFTGDQCPQGQAKLKGMCVIKD